MILLQLLLVLELQGVGDVGRVLLVQIEDGESGLGQAQLQH